MGRFPNLDALRTFAFLLVYLQHGFGVRGAGEVGVSIFFVLSGFLITHLMLAERDRTNTLDVGAFIMRRILRIWPLYYTVLLLAFVVYPLGKIAMGMSPYVHAEHPMWYAAFLSNFAVISLGGQGAMFTNITWSVAIEEQFYLLWPVVFRFTPAARLPLAIIAIAGLSFAFRLSNAGNSVVLYFHTLSVLTDLALGGLAACLTFGRTIRWPRTGTMALVIAATSAVVVFRDALFAPPFLLAASRLIIGAAFAFIIVEQSYGKASVLKLGRVGIFTRLGKYTYGLYLLHPFALIIAGVVVPRLLVGPVGLLLSVAMAYASYRVIEKPFLAIKERFTPSPDQPFNVLSPLREP